MFAAEDYKTVYESYVNANFQAYDFDSIRESMVDYIRNNYPESYNDWVESAEFVALLDVIAQFGHSLAFRVDLNSRNNFLSTAERQDAILKLSEFLGYQPRRNLAAFGELKVVAVKTNETVIGSEGTTLAGQDIRFESTNSVDNIDNFVTVMNAVFASSNQFGSPRQQATINGILTQFYNLNNAEDQISFSFTGSAQGESVDFSAIGVNYDTVQKVLTENTPNPQGAFTVIYKNDGRGISSENTGFFVGFKQGTLSYQDFTIEDPISSQTLDVNAEDVNNTDCWVQTIDENGNPTKTWTKVESVSGQNAIYNTIEMGVRDIFAVKTRENNAISIQFADERFGNLPRGVIRVWYRTSENATYTLRPEDVGSNRISISYIGADGNTYQAVLTLQLKRTVTNASSSESMDDIKTNAPRIFATQDRMITAQDYNSYLLKQSDDIAKIKSINRTHSGHSRFIDFNDPTGMYTKVRLYGTDGTLAKANKRKLAYASGITEEDVFKTYIKPVLGDDELVNLYYAGYKNTFVNLKTKGATGTTAAPSADALNYVNSAISAVDEQIFLWQNPVLDTTDDTSTGWFITESYAGVASEPQRVGHTTTTYLRYITPGALIKFKEFGDSVAVTSTTGFVSGQEYTINNPGNTDFTALGAADNNKYTTFTASFATQPATGQTGTVFPTTTKWAKASSIFANGLGIDASNGAPSGRTASNNGAIALDTFVKNGSQIMIVYPAFARQFSNSEKTNIINFIKSKSDFAIKFDFSNTTWDVIERRPAPSNATAAFPTDTNGDLNFTYDDLDANSQDNNWIIHVDYDTDSDVDKWNITSRVLRYSITSPQIEFSNLTNEFSLDEDTKKKKRDTIDIQKIQSPVVTGTFYIYGYEFDSAGEAYGLYNPNKAVLSLVDNNADDRPDDPESFTEIVPSGDSQANLRFEWTHIPSANEVVDPSFTNLIDVFVLTRNYDTEYRSWLGDQRGALSQPYPPTISELNQSFNQNITKKAMSDTIIYRPVAYKVLFGSKAQSEFQAKFRIIKIPGVTLTDNEIKNRVVDAITDFFDIANWDFGETFYFTELAAYVHKETSGVLSSFVIVPEGASSVFGDLFEVTPMSNELFIPDVNVNDIDIIENITNTNIRAATS